MQGAKFFSKLIVYQMVTLISLPTLLYAQNVAPIAVIDVESPESAEVTITPPEIETITISPEDLLPQEGPVYLNEEKPGILKRTFHTIFLFGWARGFTKWVRTKPEVDETEEQRKVRQQWEYQLGRDYFYAYYKYKEAEDKIRETTEFDLYGYEAEPHINIFDRKAKITFTKEF